MSHAENSFFITGRQLPHDASAEAAIIGALLIDPRKIDRCRGLLPEHFAVAEYSHVFHVISERQAAGKPISIKIFANDLALASIGGTQHLSAVASAAATVINVDAYAALIIDFFRRRKLIELGEKLISDAYAAAHGDAAEIAAKGSAELLATAAGHNTAWMDASAIAPQNIRWAWQNRIIAGRINLIAGMGDVGKDVLCCSLAACATTGRDWPDGAPGMQPVKTGIIAPEDDAADTIVPRLIAAGADLSMIRIWDRSRAHDPQPADMAGIGVLIASPLIDLMRSDQDMNREQDARAFLQLWQTTGATVIGTAHLSKKNDLNIAQRVLGASGILNFVRSTWLVRRDEEDKSLRLFLRLKANLSPDDTTGLQYRIQHIGPHSQSIACAWCGMTDQAADVQAGATNGSTSQASAALPWLLGYLREQGETERNVIVIDAADAGHSADAIRQAFSRAKGTVVSRREGRYGKAYWRIQEH